MRRAVLALLFLACAGRAPVAPTMGKSEPAPLIVPSGCWPDDGLDDAACIQSAIDIACMAGGGTVHLESGAWVLYRPAEAPGNRDNASLWIECTNLTLEGEGSTNLAMTGSGSGTDWTGVRIGGNASRVTVRGLTIHSDAATDLNEQTHLLFLGAMVGAIGPITNVQLHNLRLRHPVRPEVAGDCLRFVGEGNALITYVDVGSVVLEACDRSGIAVQRAVQHVDIHDVIAIDIGKTGIDMEPSGAGAIAWFNMRNLDFANSGITIAGQTSTWSHDIVLANSNIGGRLGVIYARDVIISGTTVEESTATGTEGTLYLRAFDRVTVTATHVKRATGSAVGPAVRINGVSGNYPTGLSMVGNTLTTETTGPAIDAESVQDWNLADNIITGNDVASYAVQVRATGRDVKGLVFTGNRIRGAWLHAWRLSGFPSNVVGAIIANNYSASIVGAGLKCEAPAARFTAPILHNGNFYLGASGEFLGCTNTMSNLP